LASGGFRIVSDTLVSVDDLYKSYSIHGLFKETIIGPIKCKMAEFRHLENREIASIKKNHPISMKFGTTADLELGDSHVIKNENF